MSEISKIIKGLAKEGRVTHEKTLRGVKFVFRPISSEETFLLETISNTDQLKDKYDAEGKINSYTDTIAKIRNLSYLAFAIESMDGHNIVEEEDTNPVKFKKRVAFKEDLALLEPEFIDILIQESNVAREKNRELYKDLKGNLGK